MAPLRTPDARLSRIAVSQLGLFTAAQALEAGLTPWVLRQRVAAGVHERLERGLYAVNGMPWTWERRALAGLLAVGPGARVSHRAAAHLLAFDGFGESDIELTVTRGRRARTSLAMVRTTAAVHPLDVVTRGRFRVTSPARTIIDLCAVGATDLELAAAIGSATRDGGTSVQHLKARLAELRGPGRHGIRALDRVLEGPVGHSHLERLFLRLAAQAGLPAPETQKTYRGETVVRVDAVWPAAKLVVEVMGHRFHSTRADLQRDAQRRTELQEMGMLVMEVTSDDLAQRPTQTLARVRRNLIARTSPAA